MTSYQKVPILNGILIAGILLFPFEVKFSLLLLIVYLAGSSSLNKPYLLSDKRSLYLLILPVILYLTYVLSLSYTDNISHGIKDLETKAALIIIPLFILFYQRKPEERAKFSFWFIISMLVASVYLILQACYEWYSTKDSEAFFYDRFSDLMHPTYFTMYLTFAGLLLIERKVTRIDDVRKSGFFFFLLLFLLTVSMFLASSRAGLTIGWILIFAQLVVYTYRKQASYLYPLGFALFMIFSVLVLSPPDSRFNVLISEVTSSGSTTPGRDTSKVDVTPVSHRLTLYKSAFNIATDHPFGVGVGDVQDELVKVYNEIGYTKAAEVRYNPHNQYLQSAVAVGWMGALLLVAFLAGLFFFGLKNRDMPLAGLAALIGFNALFESVFEVQRGVIFFSVSLLFMLINHSSYFKIKN